MRIAGPAIILNQTSTILVEPGCEAYIDDFGNVEITIGDNLANKDAKLYASVE